MVPSTLALGLAFLAGAFALAQEHAPIGAQPNTVLVGADGKYDAIPDTATIEFAISAQEEQSSAAYEKASKSAAEIRQILGRNGVEAEAARFGYFAIQPVYDYRTPKQKLIGYRVNVDVVLKLRDFSRVGRILDQLAKSDATESQQLSYTLEDKDEAKRKAVEDAYRRARDSAEAVARAGGRTLGEMVYASVDTFENVTPIRPLAVAMPRVASEEAQAPTAEFSPQTVTVTAHVNAVFQLK